MHTKAFSVSTSNHIFCGKGGVQGLPSFLNHLDNGTYDHLTKAKIPVPKLAMLDDVINVGYVRPSTVV